MQKRCKTLSTVDGVASFGSTRSPSRRRRLWVAASQRLVMGLLK